MWGWERGGEARKPCSQPGLGPPSVLVLVFLLMFLNLIVLRGCKSFLEGGRERDAEPGRQAEAADSCRWLGAGLGSGPLPRRMLCGTLGWCLQLAAFTGPCSPWSLLVSGSGGNGGGPSGARQDSPRWHRGCQ